MKKLMPLYLHTRCASYLFSLIGAMSLLAAVPLQAADPAPDQATAKFEVQFMENMIDHHTMATHMAQECLGKAVHQEVRTLCEEMKAEQRKEIATMQSWLSGWYGLNNYQPKMNESDQQQMQKLSMVNNSEYEIHFMKQMIQHHKTAVRKGAQCIERAYHDELEGLCEEMVMSQIEELRRMKDGLCTWYGMCGKKRES